MTVRFRKRVGRTHRQEEPGVQSKQVREAAIRDRQQGADDRADERRQRIGGQPTQRLASVVGRRFSDSRLERAIDRVAGGLGYSVEEHEVVLLGACADCS